MSRNDPTGAEPVVCPYVGLAGDPRTRFSFPVQAHRCHARSKPAKVDLATQGAYCLSSRYPTCDRYHPPEASANAAGDPRLSVAAAVAGEAEAAPAAAPEVTTPGVQSTLTPEPEPEPKPAAELPPQAEFRPQPEPQSGVEPAMPPAVPEAPPPEAAATAGFRPSSPPPTAWTTATTSSVLAAILPPPARPIPAPPSGGETPDAGPDPTKPDDTDPVATATPKSSWFDEATTAAVTLVPLPKSAPPAEPSGAGQVAIEGGARSRSLPHRPGSRRNRRGRVLLLLALLVVLAGAALAAAVATGSLDRLRPAGRLPGGVAALPSVTAIETKLADSPSLVASAPTAAAASPPGAAAAPSLAAGPTVVPTGAVAPLVTHIVQSGGSLTSSAAQYVVTPQAIRRANSLKDANLIGVDQKLIISTGQ